MYKYNDEKYCIDNEFFHPVYVRKHIEKQHADETDDEADESQRKRVKKQKKREGDIVHVHKVVKGKAAVKEEPRSIVKKKKSAAASGTKLKISKDHPQGRKQGR